ncbi:MAG: hypothetical protein HZB99_04535 [Candidatus Harrisonbacteria bacterium]|nr:hypothetical protein [Candidatus Harrisonbacteria bacterium]
MKISHSQTTSLAIEMVRAILQHRGLCSMAQVNGRWVESDLNIESREGLEYQDQRRLSMKIRVYSPGDEKKNWVEGLIKAEGIMSISRQWAKIRISFLYRDVGFDQGKVADCTFDCEASKAGKILVRPIENLSSDAPFPYTMR